MRVGILGPVEVTVADQPVEIGGARLRALLVRLALEPGRPVATEALAYALWGDAPPGDQTNALQSLVSRLRRLLPAESVSSGPAGYQLDIEPDEVDAVCFERLATSGRNALRQGDAVAAVRMLRDGLTLWRGPALFDMADAPYAVAPAARLEELRLAATEDRIEAELGTDRVAEQLVAELEALTAEHPLRERLGALRVRALHAAGRQAEALAVYEEFRHRLADELGVDPSPALRDAHLAVLRGSTTLAEPARRTGNLRAALTSFVGRREELNLIGKALTDSRLVTLVGPGGAGKTRLATTAAASAEMPDGVWLIELAPVSDPADVPLAVLRALGQREGGLLDTHAPAAQPRDALAVLLDALAPAEALLVLDNCEHLVDAAARLADDLLSRCPRLRVLATSREPLGILGEALCPVAPLRLPLSGASLDEALEYPAVQLLRDRAAAVRPGFALSDETIGTVVEICRRLDGLPLAIELAAARLRAMSLEQVADRLDDRFRLLTGGSRTAMPRHRTLRAVVAWSWDLLGDEERLLVDRLAVFPGAITEDSARGVCAGNGVPADAIGDLLDALVDKSLLQVVGDAAGRYRMLETIREYGLERLAEAGEVGRLQVRHAAHFLAFAETAEPHLRRAEQLDWMALLTAERDNLRAALHFACDTGDADTAIRLGAALSLLWTIQGESADAAAWLGRALEVPGDAPHEARAIVTAAYYINQAFVGGYQMPSNAAERLVEMVRDIDPATTHPLLSLIIPAVAMFTDDTARGHASAERGMTHPDPWVRATLTSFRGFMAENEGDATGMLTHLTAAADAFRQIGERWGLSTALTSLADAYTKRGEFEAAAEALEESIRLVSELNPADDAGYQQIRLAGVRAHLADVASVRAELNRFVTARPSARQARDTAFALLLLGELARNDGDLSGAERYYTDAWSAQERAPLVAPQFRALLRASFGHVAAGRGDWDSARTAIAEAIDLALDGMDMPVAATVALATAALYRGTGDHHRAARVLGATEALRGGPDRSNWDAERLANQLREALGEAEFVAAFAEGRSLDQAGALAAVDPRSARSHVRRR